MESIRRSGDRPTLGPPWLFVPRPPRLALCPFCPRSFELPGKIPDLGPGSGAQLLIQDSFQLQILAQGGVRLAGGFQEADQVEVRFLPQWVGTDRPSRKLDRMEEIPFLAPHLR